MRLGRPGRRLSIGFGVVCVLLLVVTGRLVQLQGVGVSDYAAAATAEHVRKEPLHAARGSIVDRNGVVLAYTADAKDVIADPSLINCTYKYAVKDQCHPQDHLTLALKLSALTGAATDKILAALALKSRYAVIAQAVPPVQAQQVDALEDQRPLRRADHPTALPGRDDGIQHRRAGALRRNRRGGHRAGVQHACCGAGTASTPTT